MEETEWVSIPTFMYRSDGAGGVEKRLFDHPDEIPDGVGWTDSPANVGAENATPPDSVGIEPPYDIHKFHKLRSELKRRTGKGTRPGTTKVQLIAMLKDLDS